MADKTTLRVEGLPELMKSLDLTTTAARAGLSRGLKKAGLYIQRESQKVVPVQTSHLKSTAFTRSSNGGQMVTVGYTAAYGIYVHENLDAAHGKAFNEKHADKIAEAKGKQKKIWFNRGENQKAKFLEDVVRESKDEILDIIKDEVNKGLGDAIK